MNDNQVAIELLARQIVQNVREILEENNRDVVAKQIKNVSVDAGNVKGLSKTVSQQVKATKFPAGQIIGLDEKVGEEVEAKFGTVTIKAAQIEDLNAEVAKITEAEIEKATITSAQIQDLEAEVAKIAAAEIESATIDTAQIKELSVKVAEIVVATIDEADIKWADIDNLTAAIANITSANIKDARIDFAQIDGLVAGQALITEAVGGKVVIKDLSVTDANIVDLNANKINAGTIAVERLVIVGSDKSIVYTINEANGTAQLSQTTIDGGSITRKTITADQIVAKGITAENLDVAEIFANEALIGVITSQHLATGSVTAGSIAAGAVEADKIKAGAVNTDKLAASVVTADKIAAGAVEADKIKAGAISAEKLAANAVTADKIASGSVEADKIKSGAITADKIAANTITANKLASDVGSGLDLSSNQSINLTVKKAVDDIEIGGRNLLKNSKGDFVMPPQNDGTASDNYYSKSFRFDPAVGETYTFSADVEITDGDFDAISVYPYPGGTLVNAPIPANGRITHTFTVSVDTITQILAYAGIAGSTRGNGVIFRNVKIEKGNKATDWTAAPEDLETRVLNAETAITETAEQISLKASKTEVTSAIDAIQVGGTNLFPNSKGPIYANSDNGYSGYFDFWGDYQGTYTLSADITKAVDDTATNTRLSLTIRHTDGTVVSGGSWPYDSTGAERDGITRRKSATVSSTPGKTVEVMYMRLMDYDSQSGRNAWAENVKLERGNKATDWSPAPEDTEERITKAETELSVQADEIKQKASKTEVDNLTGRITDAEAQIVTQAGEIQMAVTEVSNISVGGTNILPGYADERSVSRNIRIPVRSILEPHVGKEICISFECKATIARAISMYAYQSSGISIRDTFSFTPSTTEFTRHSFKTTVYDWGQKEGLSTGEIIFHDYAGEQNYTIRKVKIELGNKPTDWSPCPDDPVKTLKNTAMTLNGNGIEMTTTGHFRLYANDGKNSRIKLGGDDETANFSVTEDGILGAIKGEFTQGLTVKNSPVWTQGNLIVSSSEPVNVHNAIWLKPTNSIQRLVHGYTLTEDINFVRDQYSNVTLAPKSADILTPGGEYKYTLTAQVQRTTSYNGSESYSAIATISTSAGTVQLATVNNLVVKDWGNGELVLEGRSAVDLFGASSNATLSIKVSSVTISYPNLKIKANTEITLTSENVNAPSQGAQACTVFYIP